MEKLKKKFLLISGIKDGIPIGLGYFAVAFALGISAYKAGLNFIQGFIASAFLNASAGEYALFNCILDGALFTELVLVMIVANCRYLLMSCALSQRINPKEKFFHRYIMGFFITDEFFGITISRFKHAEPLYMYGAIMVASPCWAIGTMLGVLVGNILPAFLVNALSVTLYGMFLAVIIPKARDNKIIMLTVGLSFAMSFLFSFFDIFNAISDSFKIIILTVVISSIVAILFPVEEEKTLEGKVQDV